MGHSIGNLLVRNGARVITCLQGRSDRSADLAQQAGIEIVADDVTLVREASVFLSILPPSEAVRLAERMAKAIQANGANLLYADCNAISPNQARRAGEIIEGCGGRFVDVGIIGNPPRADRPGPRLFASGPHAAEFAELTRLGLDIRLVRGEIGQASGLKMCYAALTKGLTALGTELMVAAGRLGLEDELRREFEGSQPNLLQWLDRQIPGMPPKAYRWVGEMLEIAATFEDAGLTPAIFKGAADMYELVGHSALASETPENRSRGQTTGDVVAALAEAAAYPA
ncbi:MAG: NAD(P)-dependent oxidoreductase [Chloroflexi bacterium]|nr:NAD(P)-dependent oxidoreductase [Chloroflexota bacterium]